MDKNAIIINTFTQCNTLADNLDILLDNGWTVQVLKNKTVGLSRELRKTVDAIYRNTENGELMINAIDLEIEIMKSISKLSLEQKQELLGRINREATAEPAEV